MPQIEKLGGQLIAISLNLPEHSLSLEEKKGLNLHVLCDLGNHGAGEFGLVFTLPSEVRPLYEQFGFDIPVKKGDNSFELPLPATYGINCRGRIVCSFVETDDNRRAEPEDILDAFRSL